MNSCFWTFDNLEKIVKVYLYFKNLLLPQDWSWIRPLLIATGSKRKDKAGFMKTTRVAIIKSCMAAWPWLPFLFYFFSHLPCQPACPCQNLYTTTKMRFSKECNILERPLDLYFSFNSWVKTTAHDHVWVYDSTFAYSKSHIFGKLMFRRSFWAILNHGYKWQNIAKGTTTRELSVFQRVCSLT